MSKHIVYRRSIWVNFDREDKKNIDEDDEFTFARIEYKETFRKKLSEKDKEFTDKNLHVDHPHPRKLAPHWEDIKEGKTVQFTVLDFLLEYKTIDGEIIYVIYEPHNKSVVKLKEIMSEFLSLGPDDWWEMEEYIYDRIEEKDSEFFKKVKQEENHE